MGMEVDDLLKFVIEIYFQNRNGILNTTMELDTNANTCAIAFYVSENYRQLQFRPHKNFVLLILVMRRKYYTQSYGSLD